MRSEEEEKKKKKTRIFCRGGRFKKEKKKEKEKHPSGTLVLEEMASVVQGGLDRAPVGACVAQAL